MERKEMPKEVQNKGTALANMVGTLTESALEGLDRSEKISVALSAMIEVGSLVSLLTSNMKHPEEDTCQEHFLFAACLFATSVMVSECDKHPGHMHAVGIDYGPHSILSAVANTEK